MIVVSDTTPLISLMKISKLSLLRDLFGEILIPEAVFLETTTNVLYKSEEALDVLQKSNQRISDKLVDAVLKRIKSEG